MKRPTGHDTPDQPAPDLPHAGQLAPGDIMPGEASGTQPGAQPSGTAQRVPLHLRAGLPRDVDATRNVTAFLVMTVATVLVTRGLLAIMGYPQVGGGGLHIAHVLWGGLLMALAVIMSLSFLGPAIRPLVAAVGGIGFGLFIDEIGKFVTSDNDYFFQPTAALVYMVVVALVLFAEWLHGRRPRVEAEFLATAADRAIAGLSAGFTARSRTSALAYAERAPHAVGSPEVTALIHAVPDGESNLPDIVTIAMNRVTRLGARALAHPMALNVLAGLVIYSTLAATLTGVSALLERLFGDGTVPAWMSFCALAFGGLTHAMAIRAVVIGKRKTPAAKRLEATLLRRTMLISLFITQIFVFRIMAWMAVVGVLVDLAVYVLLDLVVASPQRVLAGSPGGGPLLLGAGSGDSNATVDSRAMGGPPAGNPHTLGDPRALGDPEDLSEGECAPVDG